jgi:hypothetical protein
VMLALLLCAAEASATPIGVFSFAVDGDPNIGPFFTVENLADPSASFSNVIIDLFSNLSLVVSLSLGDLAPLTLVQTLDDLTALSFDAAFLTFGFGSGVVANVVLTALSFLCDGTTCSSPFAGPVSTSIDFDPGNIPEPSALLLVATGVTAVLRGRGPRRRLRP